MSKLMRIQAIDYKRKMFFINPDYVVELAQCDDDTFYVQLTTAWYSIDKQSFISIRQQLQSVTKEEDTRKKIKIDECSMTPRLSNLMCNFGYEYLEDVYDFWVSNGDNGLLKKNSFGRKSLNELKDIFKKYKLQETKK